MCIRSTEQHKCLTRLIVFHRHVGTHSRLKWEKIRDRISSWKWFESFLGSFYCCCICSFSSCCRSCTTPLIVWRHRRMIPVWTPTPTRSEQMIPRWANCVLGPISWWCRATYFCSWCRSYCYQWNPCWSCYYRNTEHPSWIFIFGRGHSLAIRRFMWLSFHVSSGCRHQWAIPSWADYLRHWWGKSTQ